MMKIQTSLFKQITPTEQSLLTNIAQSRTATAYRAQALLFMAKGYEYPVFLPPLPNGEDGGSTVFKTNNSLVTNPKISLLYPNPADEKVYITHELEQDAKAVLNIYDLSGKTLCEKKLQGNATQTIDTRGLQNGLYLYTFCKNGIVLHRGKLVIIH